MHTGYYLTKDYLQWQYQQPYYGYDFMTWPNFFNKQELNGTDMFKYLHGFCDWFAITLGRKFDYTINSIWDKQTNSLMHAYCTQKVGNITYYIDSRGITDNYNEFINEFAHNDYKRYPERYTNIVSSSVSEFIKQCLSVQNTWFNRVGVNGMTSICNELDSISTDIVFSNNYDLQKQIDNQQPQQKPQYCYDYYFTQTYYSNQQY